MPLPDREGRHRLHVVITLEPVHEDERFALGKDPADAYFMERVHFQKSKKLYHWSG